MSADQRRLPLLAAASTILLWAFTFPASRAALVVFSGPALIIFDRLRKP